MARDVRYYDPYYESETRTRRRRLKVLVLFDKRFRVVLAVVSLSVVAYLYRIVWWRGADKVVPERVAASETRDGLPVGCRPYGCPIYPAELDSDVRKEIEKLKERQLSDGRSGEDSSSLRLRYGNRNIAALTQKGKDHIENQDRGIIVSPFQARGGPSDFFVGIFDGHADEGHKISGYLARDMPSRIWEKLTSPSNDDTDEAIKRVLFETFVEADEEAPPNAMNGGSTASVVLRRNSKLFIANVGDSLSFIATYSKSTGSVDIVYRNRFDKPHLPEERARIESMGGKVHIPEPPKPPSMARVVAYSSIKREMVGLAMSRSVGDWEHGALGVIAEPIVDVVSIDDILKGHAAQGDVELFVVSGSDGLFDSRRPIFVANHLVKSFYHDNGKHPVVECENIIQLATPKNPNVYRDDITILALRLDIENGA